MPVLTKELFYFHNELKKGMTGITTASCKEESLKKGLRIGQEVRISKPKGMEWGRAYEMKANKGIVTGLYPYIFTVELQGKTGIKTSFLYFQVLNKEVELC